MCIAAGPGPRLELSPRWRKLLAWEDLVIRSVPIAICCALYLLAKGKLEKIKFD